MVKVRTPFSYQGSKLKELKRIQSIIGENIKIAEPFFGSGIITGELGASNGCVVNDLNTDIYSIWKYSMEGSDTFFSKISSLCSEENRHQDYYYKKREQYNLMWRNNEYNVDRAALFFFLLNSCHAAMVRYGPNGFNTSYKLFLSNGRYYNIEAKIIKLKRYSSKIKKIHNTDALNILKANDLHVDVIYCDPPYTNSTSVYQGGWDNDKYLELIELLRFQKNKNDINSLVSNYSSEEYDAKFDNVVNFKTKRMASTKVVEKNDILGIIGDFDKHNLEKFLQ